MKTVGKHMSLRIEDVELDTTNPRIQRFLDFYDGPLTSEHIYLALGAGADDQESAGGTTFNRLKQSIITNGGIIQPILVNSFSNGKKICIEGNTRLALYRQFVEEGVTGKWDEIPAMVYDGLDEEDIDAIRLQAHLVGPRQWDPYSKAKYLSYLRVKQRFSFGRLVDYCGGSQKAVKESIDAFHDMENYYRPILESPSDFDARRFSGFVELQKPGIKHAIMEAGFTISDFASWVHNRKIEALNQVRWLPSILKEKTAKQIFLKDGASAAIKVLDRPDLSKTLKEASLIQLARALTDALGALAWTEVQRLKLDGAENDRQHLLDTFSSLETLVNEFPENR
jgi:hypothetical protein